MYVPLRYYHQPHGRSDANGLGTTSRFLTEHVQHTRPVDQTAEPEAKPELAASISVSVDELWR